MNGDSVGCFRDWWDMDDGAGWLCLDRTGAGWL